MNTPTPRAHVATYCAATIFLSAILVGCQLSSGNSDTTAPAEMERFVEHRDYRVAGDAAWRPKEVVDFRQVGTQGRESGFATSVVFARVADLEGVTVLAVDAAGRETPVYVRAYADMLALEGIQQHFALVRGSERVEVFRN